MKRGVSRIAIYLCLLLVLNEFGPAHFRRLENERAETKALNKKHGKRAWTGAVASLGSLVFKAMELTSKYFSDITSLISIFSTVYTLVADCSNTAAGKRADELVKEAEEIAKKINEETPKLHEIQLETKNLQVKVETMNYHFNETLRVMELSGEKSEELLRSVSPDILSELANETIQLEAQLQNAQQAQTKTDYVALSKSYITRTTKIVNLAIPAFTALVPRIPKILEFGQARLNTLKSFELSKKFPNVIKLPKVNSPTFRKMNSWFAKPKAFLSSAKNAVRGKVKFSYEKAVSYAKNFAKGFGVVTGFIFGAYNIYTTIQNANQCQKKVTEAEQALERMKDAQKNFEEVRKNTTDARDEMLRVKDEILSQFSSNIFLEDVTNMALNMKALQGDGDGMKDMIDAAETYVDKARGNTNIDEVEILLRELYEKSMFTLPSVYECLKRRTLLIELVTRQCKEGKGTLSTLINDQRMLQADERNEEACVGFLGIPFFDEATLTGMIEEVSVTQGFDKVCLVNSAKKHVCDDMCAGNSASEISKKREIPVDAVERLIPDCSLPCTQIPDELKSIACRFIDKGGSRQQVFDFMFDNLPKKLGYTLQMVEELDCSKQDKS